MIGSKGIRYFTLTNMVIYVLQIQLDWLRDCKLLDRNFCGWSYIGAVLDKVTSTQEKRRLIFLFLFRVETASLSTAANGARPFPMLVCLLIIRMDQFMRDRRKSEAGFRHSVTSVETTERVLSHASEISMVWEYFTLTWYWREEKLNKRFSDLWVKKDTFINPVKDICFDEYVLSDGNIE